MSDATLPLQAALIEHLRGNAALRALVGTPPAEVRIYDVPRAGTEKPYISLGPIDSLTEEADDYDGADITVQIDAWSAGPASTESKRLGAALHDALHEQELNLSGHRLIALTVDTIRYLTEPDGITRHAAVIVRARTEPVA